MKLSLIVATAKNWTIGRQGDLPWNLPGDMAHFKRTTLGKPVIMGRKTYETLRIKPLPERTNIILTRDKAFQAEGCIIVHSLEDALQLPECQQADEVMVIGGEQIYQLAFPLTQRIYLTQVHAEFDGDASFPALNFGEWLEVDKEFHVASGQNAYAFTISCFEKVGSAIELS